MIGDILEGIESAISTLHEKFPGVVVGQVMSVTDPMMLGRVQVKLPFIDSSDTAPWARVATPMSGSSMGFYFIPRVDDEVLVAFEHGSPSAPYVIGSLWNANNPPPLPSPSVETRQIKTPKGIEITLADIPPTVTIQTPNEEKIELSDSGITITSGSNKVEIGAPAQPTLKITSCSNSIELSASGVKVTGSPSIELSAPTIKLSADAVCTIQGSLVKIN